MEDFVLLPPFDALWRGRDPIAAAFSLQGEEFRHVKNRHTFRVEVQGRGYFVKLHHGVGWKEIWKNLLMFKRPVTGARNEFRAIEMMRRLEIPTMTAAAFGERGCDPAHRDSFLITEELTDVISLEELGKASVSPLLRVRLVKALAASVGAMHRAGVNHRDCYLCHYLLDQKTLDDPEPRLYVIDLHRAQIRKQVPRRYQIKDLGGLMFSAYSAGLTCREALRFIRLYSGKSLRRELSENGRFWRDVKKNADKLFQKEFGKAPPEIRPLFPAVKPQKGDEDHE